MDQRAREHSDEIRDFVPGDDQLRHMKKRLQEYGVSIPTDQIFNIMNTPTNRRVHALHDIQIRGIQPNIEEGLARLDAFAQKLDGDTARTDGGGTIHFRTVQSDDSCKAFEGIIDTLTMIDGMLWLAGLVLPPLEVAAAVLLIFIGFLMLVDTVYC